MKKLFVFLVLFSAAASVFAQSDISVYAGVWKLTLKNSGGKMPPPPQYILFKSNSTYLWGVDSLGAEPQQGAISGTWFVTSRMEIVMISSDSTMETRYYYPQGSARYRFDPTQKGKIKERSQMLEMDIYLEKL